HVPFTLLDAIGAVCQNRSFETRAAGAPWMTLACVNESLAAELAEPVGGWPKLLQERAGVQLQPVLGAPVVPQPPGLESADANGPTGGRQALEGAGVRTGGREPGQ